MQTKVRHTTRASGDEQMRLDLEMLHEAVVEGSIIVRGAVWNPPAVSIGRRQEPRGPLDPGRLAGLGLHLVRRPTGGLTIVHEPSTFTLHVAIPHSHPLYGRPVDEAALEIARAIAWSLERQGLPARARGSEWRARLTPYPTQICLAYTSPADLVAPDGRRVGGIALRYTGRALIAQAVVLAGPPDYRLWASVDGYPSHGHLERVFTSLASEPPEDLEGLASKTAESLAYILARQYTTT